MSLMVNPPKEGDESCQQYKEERAATLASLRRRAHTMTDAFNACEGVTCNFTEGAMYSFPRLHLPPKVRCTAACCLRGLDSKAAACSWRCHCSSGIATAPLSATLAPFQFVAWLHRAELDAMQQRAHSLSPPALCSAAPSLRQCPHRAPVANAKCVHVQAIEAAKKAGKPADTFYCLALLEETGILTVPGAGFGQREGTFHLRTTILPPEDQMPKLTQRFQAFHKKFMETYR